jgi:AbrB family looped-hinge helix DNA binding protein
MTVKKQYSSPISVKGQVTVPKEIRNRLGVAAGDRVEFVIDGNLTLIRPSRQNDNPFSKFRGILGPFPGGEAGIKAWIDDIRNDEE